MSTDKQQTYSVLMAVYKKEDPVFFRQSIESMIEQTLPFTDFVLVCDGPLTKALERVIHWAEERLGERFQCIRLKENRGLGNALRIGVPRCRCSVIARMDSDDISRPDRCENSFESWKETGILLSAVPFRNLQRRQEICSVSGFFQGLRRRSGSMPKKEIHLITLVSCIEKRMF